jgi:hypothetical protein
MNLSEKAKEYASGKGADAITAAIEQAYINGYNAGYEDCKANIKPEIVEDEVEYVDLGLPSGTLWSNGCKTNKEKAYLYFSYDDAAKHNIPTKEQYQELIVNCEIIPITNSNGYVRGYKYLGRSGISISIFLTDLIPENKKGNRALRYWLRDEDEGNTRLCAFDRIQTDRVFMGYKLPIMLVK